MTNNTSGGRIIYCADGIVRYDGKFVVIERLNSAGKLALPGGKQEFQGDIPEPLTETLTREIKEETGLSCVTLEPWCMRAEIGRDPRGHFVACVFVVDAVGVIRGEEGKTKPLLLTQAEIEARIDDFAFDHGDIYRVYFSRHTYSQPSGSS